jgi:hypothetical protein
MQMQPNWYADMLSLRILNFYCLHALKRKKVVKKSLFLTENNNQSKGIYWINAK